MPDLYYDPEHFGLDLVWTAEDNEPYQFDIVAVWGSKLSGALYVGRDSGCSCPSPFETLTRPDSVNELERIDTSRGRDPIRATLLGVLEEWRYAYDDTTTRALTADREKQASLGADAVERWLAAQQKEIRA